MTALATTSTLLADQAEQAFSLLRLAWLLLGLTGVGLFGVILLAVLRRAYVRSQRSARSPDQPSGAGRDSDAWAESARRFAEEPAPDDNDEDDLP
jgi:hypothetical protein